MNKNHEFDTYIMIGDDAVDCTVTFSYKEETESKLGFAYEYTEITLISVKINAGMDCAVIDMIDNLNDDNEVWLDAKCVEYLNKLNFRS